MGRPDWESEYVDFFVARAPALRRTAYLMCGDWQIAEDLVQTTFVRLYVHWRRVRQETVDAYARRILTNLFLSRRRTAHRELVTAEPPDRHDPAPEFGGWLELADALSGLTDRQRAIVALRYVDDLPVAEVAELLGIAEGTVKSHPNRALQALRSALETQLERPTR
ncbi:SigE family RNA polymerase sigma factor [Kribbella sp. NBC_01245]|uniref:SigE family RNA polymerase sigma factor n=1 Tax=Kribbella sp. NBC_01245 TaxID=2903578 RepID=UPI002E2E48C5|nr:SigE family RNA polymerase sigma factor [Kribbella sp. NBC_01245]